MNPANQKTVGVGLVQMRCSADRDQNLDHALTGIRKAASAGAQIICLPELFLTPYFCQRQDPKLFDLAESIPGPTTDRLSSAARESEVCNNRLDFRAPRPRCLP